LTQAATLELEGMTKVRSGKTAPTRSLSLTLSFISPALRPLQS
jgi:hypothetical protein